MKIDKQRTASMITALSLILASSHAVSASLKTAPPLFIKTQANVLASINKIEPDINKTEEDLKKLRKQSRKEEIELVRNRANVIAETSIECYNAQLKAAKLKTKISRNDWRTAHQRFNKLSGFKNTALTTNSIEELENTHQGVLSIRNNGSLKRTLTRLELQKERQGISQALESNCPQ